MRLLTLALVLMMNSYTLAQEQTVDLQPHPAFSENPAWAGSIVILILGLFLAAAVIGPSVRANAPEEYPPQPHEHEPEASEQDDQHGPRHGHGAHH